MPKGVYERKPRQRKNTMSEAGIAALRKNMEKARSATGATMSDDARKNRAENWQKALEAQRHSPAAIEAKRQNAGKAVAIRTARAILKHLPVGAAAGTVFQATRYRRLTVIDAAPVPNGEVWEQKFHQSGKIVIYGFTHDFDNDCRIVWHYRPTLENIMDSPMFEEQAGGSDE